MKNILYICDQSPFVNSFGAQQRSNLLCDALCETAQVDLVCFTSETRPEIISKPNCNIRYFGELPAQVPIFKNIRLEKLLNIFYSLSPYSVYNKNREAYNITHSLIRHNQYDYIVIRYIKNAFLCGLFDDKRVIVDVDDLPEQSILSYVDVTSLSWIKYLQYKFYAKRAGFHTNRFLKKINHSFFSNENQCIWKNSSHLPNIPFPKRGQENEFSISPSNDNDHIVLFVGYMHHSPNIHGVDYFIKNIWQKVNEAIPAAIFNIAGEGITPEQKSTWEEYKGVNVLGFVPDLYRVYQKCKVVVVPVYYGAGSNIKVLEAMDRGKPCVISDFAKKAFGNGLIENKQILVGRNDQDFADKVINLLKDRDLNLSIATEAKRIIAELYSYSVFIEKAVKYIQ